jgi:hypothetical protein
MELQAGYVAVGRPPFLPGSGWNVSGTHTTSISGSMTQSVTFSDSTVAYLNHLTVSNAQGLDLPAGTTVRGQLRLVNGGRLTVASFGALKVASRIPDVSGGVYDVAMTSVIGAVTGTKDETLATRLFVERGGTLSPGGHRLDVTSLTTGEGLLVMNDPSDSLIVREQADFYGPAALTAGSLVLKGDVRISRMGGNASAFAGSSAHRTVFAGAGTQNVYMPDDGQSYFGSIQLDGPGVVVLNDSIDVHGRLLAFGNGTLRSQSGRRVTVRGGLNVGALTMDGVWLDVDGGTLSRFDNVTFRSFGGGPALLRVRHPGTGSAFTMHNVVFDVPSGYGPSWIEASDTDPATGALQLDVVSPQAANGPAATVVSNGASVGWRTE